MRRSFILILVPMIILPILGAGCITIKTNKSIDGGIFRSDDSGETWTQKVFIRQEKKKVISLNNANVVTFIFHPTDKKIIYLGTGQDGLYRTKDGGDHWESYGLTTGEITSLSIDPQTTTTVYVSTGTNILKTSNDGINWETIYLEPRNQKITSVNVDLYNPSRILAVTEMGYVIQSTDYGENWTALSSINTKVKKLYLNPKDTRIIYAVTNDQGIGKSTDNGITWHFINADLEKYNGAKLVNWFTFTEQDPDILYIATNYGLLKSPNGGANWELIKTLFPFGTVPIKTVAVNPANYAEIWFTIGKVIHKTTDSSVTWKTIETFPSNRTINTLIVNPDYPQTLYTGTYAAKKR